MKNDGRLLRDALRCPVCGAAMTFDGTVGAGILSCAGARRHSFDAAKSGYVHLAPRHSGGGDAKEAVRARTAFLGAGYYEPAAAELCRLLRRYVPGGVVIDAGCGEGYYTNRMDAAGEGRYEVCGFDLSRDAVDAAAKAARRDGRDSVFAVASVFEMPLADASVDAVVNIFAPCAEAEFCRVLKPGGVLILLGAGEKHLLGLKKVLYENPYENVGRADLPVGMEQAERSAVRGEIEVTGGEQIENLFSMTPYYWRTSPGDREKLARLSSLRTEIDFDCRVYRKTN